MTRRDQVQSAVAQPLPPPVPRTGRDWSDRQRLRAVDALRYSRFVSIMKGLLPLAAVALMVAVIVYSAMPRHQDKGMVMAKSGNLSRDLTMTKTSFTGTDDKGNPFKITAAEVIQDPTVRQDAKGKNKLRAELKQVDADIQFQNESWINAAARHGFIDAEAGILTLDGGISVFTDSGYELHTPSARADIKANILQGDEGVQGHGPSGQFSADHFYFDRLKGQIKLSGHVKTILYPQKAKTR